MKMHSHEIDIDEVLVKRLLAGQFPHLAGLPIRAVQSTGTVNALYRLGEQLCVRLPRVPSWAEGLEKELVWLPKLAPHLPLRIPQPVSEGQPTNEFPFLWAIYTWLDGQPYSDDLIHDECQAAVDLAQFVLALRRLDPSGVPQGGRRPLSELDTMTRTAIEQSRDVIDGDAAMAAWVSALEAPAWDGMLVWIHADLLRPNLLVDQGRLSAVIDFGSIGVGDPAADLIAAWSVFNQPGRRAYRAALQVDDGTWSRARGYALHQAALIIPYYAETNPGFVALAKRTVDQILGDMSL